MRLVNISLISFIASLAACASNPPDTATSGTPSAGGAAAVAAETPSSAATDSSTLKFQMKAMGSRFKKISTQLGAAKDDAARNELAVMADEIVTFAQKAKAFTPKRIASGAAGEIAKNKAEYDKDLDDLMSLAKDLGEALRKNDGAKIKGTLAKMKSRQKESHDEFQEPDKK